MMTDGLTDYERNDYAAKKEITMVLLAIPDGQLLIIGYSFWKEGYWIVMMKRWRMKKKY